MLAGVELGLFLIPSDGVPDLLPIDLHGRFEARQIVVRDAV